MWKNKNCEFRIPLTHDNQVWTCGGNWEVGTRTTGSKYSLRKKKERYCLVTTQIIWVSDVLLTTNKVKGLKWLSLTLLPFINFPCEMKGEINAPHPHYLLGTLSLDRIYLSSWSCFWVGGWLMYHNFQFCGDMHVLFIWPT